MDGLVCEEQRVRLVEVASTGGIPATNRNPMYDSMMAGQTSARGV